MADGGDAPARNYTRCLLPSATNGSDAGGPYVGGEGQPIVFDASASSDRDGTIVAYEWDFDLDGLFEASGAAT